MHSHKICGILFGVLIAMVVGCGGLDPGSLPPDSFVQGKVTYVGGVESWPDTNVFRVHILAFETQPATEDDIVTAISEGKVVVSDSLSRWVAESSYSFKIPSPPKTFNYVVVAMQNGPNFLKDWLMIGVHCENGQPDKPLPVVVPVATSVTVDFTVDFTNLPPQPFK